MIQLCIPYIVAKFKISYYMVFGDILRQIFYSSHPSCLFRLYGVKAVPLEAWSGPEGSRKLTFPDFVTTAQDGGKVVSLTHRPPLPPENAPGTHFC